MQFPVAIPGEGLIDVVVQTTVRYSASPTWDGWLRFDILTQGCFMQMSRMQALSCIDGGPEGKPFHLDSVRVFSDP